MASTCTTCNNPPPTGTPVRPRPEGRARVIQCGTCKGWSIKELRPLLELDLFNLPDLGSRTKRRNTVGNDGERERVRATKRRRTDEPLRPGDVTPAEKVAKSTTETSTPKQGKRKDIKRGGSVPVLGSTRKSLRIRRATKSNIPNAADADKDTDMSPNDKSNYDNGEDVNINIDELDEELLAAESDKQDPKSPHTNHTVVETIQKQNDSNLDTSPPSKHVPELSSSGEIYTITRPLPPATTTNHDIEHRGTLRALDWDMRCLNEPSSTIDPKTKSSSTNQTSPAHTTNPSSTTAKFKTLYQSPDAIHNMTPLQLRQIRRRRRNHDGRMTRSFPMFSRYAGIPGYRRGIFTSTSAMFTSSVQESGPRIPAKPGTAFGLYAVPRKQVFDGRGAGVPDWVTWDGGYGFGGSGGAGGGDGNKGRTFWWDSDASDGYTTGEEAKDEKERLEARTERTRRTGRIECTEGLLSLSDVARMLELVSGNLYEELNTGSGSGSSADGEDGEKGVEEVGIGGVGGLFGLYVPARRACFS